MIMKSYAIDLSPDYLGSLTGEAGVNPPWIEISVGNGRESFMTRLERGHRYRFDEDVVWMRIQDNRTGRENMAIDKISERIGMPVKILGEIRG